MGLVKLLISSHVIISYQLVRALDSRGYGLAKFEWKKKMQSDETEITRAPKTLIRTINILILRFRAETRNLRNNTHAPVPVQLTSTKLRLRQSKSETFKKPWTFQNTSQKKVQNREHWIHLTNLFHTEIWKASIDERQLSLCVLGVANSTVHRVLDRTGSGKRI